MPRKSNSRKQEILAVAANLFIKHGYQSTTVRAIGEAAGILSGSLYHHYRSKEDFADEIIRTYIYHALNLYKEAIATQKTPRGKFEMLVRAAVMPVPHHRAALLVLQQEGRELMKKERFAYIANVEVKIEAIWRSVVRQGIKDGSFNATIDPSLPFYIIRDAIVSVARWFDPRGRLTVDEFAQQYVTVFMHGVCHSPSGAAQPASRTDVACRPPQKGRRK